MYLIKNWTNAPTHFRVLANGQTRQMKNELDKSVFTAACCAVLDKSVGIWRPQEDYPISLGHLIPSWDILSMTMLFPTQVTKNSWVMTVLNNSLVPTRAIVPRADHFHLSRTHAQIQHIIPITTPPWHILVKRPDRSRQVVYSNARHLITRPPLRPVCLVRSH